MLAATDCAWSRYGRATYAGDGNQEPDLIRDAASVGRRSPLYRWMRQNHRTFSEALVEAGRPNWAEIARVLGENGLTDLNGRPPSSETTRQTWHKVKRALANSPTPVGRAGKAQPARAPVGHKTAQALAGRGWAPPPIDATGEEEDEFKDLRGEPMRPHRALPPNVGSRVAPEAGRLPIPPAGEEEPN